MPWAKVNALVVNPEWWEEAWNPYLAHIDLLIFKCAADKERFVATHTVKKAAVLPWTTPVTQKDFAALPKATKHSAGCVWFLGPSENKRAAASAVLPLWKPEWPQLHVYSMEQLDVGPIAKNVSLHIQDTPEENRRRLQAYSPCHLIFSASEALSLAAHEGQAAGAFLLGNALPTFVEAFGVSDSAALTEATLEPVRAGVRDTFASLADSLEAAMSKYLRADISAVRVEQVAASISRRKAFSDALIDLMKTTIVNEKPSILPPQLTDYPPISIVTLLHNRRKFVDLALHNLLITDYPKNKIEWVVVEDSDIQEEQASDKIIKFGRAAAPMSVSYIPLQKKTSIGEKRNTAVSRAQHDIILMMDDDDHYPESSFRRRVSWLLSSPKVQAAACTTIACYDLVSGVSAVNTPPWTLPLRQRVSEATLTFRKSWWMTKPFPSVNNAEGDGFLERREADVVEMPPQQIIVAMSHGYNASSRRIPGTGKPSCFWGFPKEFLTFLHGLAGVQVEAD